MVDVFVMILDFMVTGDIDVGKVSCRTTPVMDGANATE